MSTPSTGGRTVDTDTDTVAEHWDDIYATRSADQLSWTRPGAGTSAELIDQLPLGLDDPAIDVGGGAGVLVDHLLAAGHRHVTVLDASQQALDIARRRLDAAGLPADQVEWTPADIRAWQAPQTYRLWHDRAVFHFLTDLADRARYRERAAASVERGGYLVIGTFAADGPTHCSGLPVCRYGPTELGDQVTPDFEIVASRAEDHHTPWGAQQQFTWLVLRR